jgi:hypothetical protein
MAPIGATTAVKEFSMRRFGILAAAGLLVMSLAGAASAATPPATTYHGDWASSDICGETFDTSGVWNVNLKNDGTASVSVRIFKEGRPHAAWGGNSFHGDWMQVSVTDPTVVFETKLIDPFRVGSDLIFVLGKNGTMTYTITNYCGSSAAVLTGHVIR